MAPNAKLINSKIFETSSTTMDVAMKGLEWACEQGAHILSNSWGGDRYDPVRNLIIALKEKYGAIFVFAAGNSGPRSGTISYPGGYPETVCVGSVAIMAPAPDTIACFSGRGPNWQGDTRPDIVAPGGNSSLCGGADECIYGASPGGKVWCVRGTSMATPHIAGSLALILEAGRTVEQLYVSARDILTVGKDNDSGWGVAQVDLAIGMPEPPEKVVLTLKTEPVSGIPFNFDGVENVTPWSAEVSGGSRIIIAFPSLIQLNGVWYAFRRWSDGFTSTKRSVYLYRDTTLTAIFEQTVAHTLTVASEPDKVTFTVNGVSKVTPYSEPLEEGSFVVKFPLQFKSGNTWYGFDSWEDGSTNPERTINLTTDISIKAYYKILPTHILTGKSVIDGADFPASIIINGVSKPTPFTEVLPEGPYELEAPYGGCHYPPGYEGFFKNWEDGSTNRFRHITLLEDMTVINYMYATGGRLDILAKNAHTQENLNVPFLMNGATKKTSVIFACRNFGDYTIEFPAEFDGLAFNFFDDGSTDIRKTFNFNQLFKVITAHYYPSASRHSLEINTNPAGIKFYLDEAKPTTPYNANLVESNYLIRMPRVAVVNGVHYVFLGWSDGVTHPIRTLSLFSEVSLTAVYEMLSTTPQTVTYPIETGIDDGMTFSTTSSTFDGDYLQLNYRCWVRWALRGIPQGARILSAKFIGVGYYTRDYPSAVGPIEFQHTDEDNARSFLYNPHSRPVSGPTAHYNLPNPWYGTLGEGYNWRYTEHEVDLTEIVQDFVNRPGYADGNYIAIRIVPLGEADIKQFTAYDANPENAPKLEVIWEMPSGTHALTVKSEPVSVDVKVDSILKGKTPVIATVVEGEHIIEVPEEVTT
jgi:hypothetical protein